MELSNNRKEPLLHSVEVCRKMELEQLIQQHQRVRGGKMALTIVEGERDIGKNELIKHYASLPFDGITLLINLDLANHSHYIEKILREIIGQLLVMIEELSLSARGDSYRVVRLREKLIELVKQMELDEHYSIYVERDNGADPLASERPWFLRRDAYITILKAFLCQASQLLIDYNIVLIIHLSNAEFGHAQLFNFLLGRLSQRHEQPAMHILLSTHNLLHARVSYMLDSIRSETGFDESYTYIKLKPLRNEDIKNIVEYHFPNRGFCSQQFTTLLTEKSGGNPGKIRFLLDLLKEKQLLFVSGAGEDAEWYVEFDRVRATIDLDEYYGESYLFIENSYCYKKIFVYAACYGEAFSPAMLKAVLPEEIQAMILPAIQKGVSYRLLEPVSSNNSEDPLLQRYTFTQVTIAENILKLEHQNQLNVIRMRLFDTLLAGLPYCEPFGEITGEHLAKLINGIGSIGINYNHTMQRKKVSVNFLSGFNALQRNDVSLAYQFLHVAVQCIKNSHWRMDYALAYHCYTAYIRCLYLKESYLECLDVIQYCMSQPLTEVDRAKLYVRRVYTLKSLDRQEEAIECALEGLAELGVHLPLHPNYLVLLYEYIQSRWILLGDLRDKRLQSCTDEKNLTIVKLYELAALSGYITNTEFLRYAVCRAVRLSGSVGYTPFSLACLVALSLVGVSGSPKPRNMHRFYHLSGQLVPKVGRSLLRETLHVAHGGPWRQPLNLCIEQMAVLQREGPNYAEPEEVSVCTLLYYNLAILKGDNFASLLADIQLAISRMEAPKYSTFNRIMRILAQMMDNLVNEKERPTLMNGPFFDERVEWLRLVKSDHLTRFCYGITKLYLALHYGDYISSRRFYRECHAHRSGVIGLATVPVYRFMGEISDLLVMDQEYTDSRLKLFFARVKRLPTVVRHLIYFKRLMRRQASSFGYLYWLYRGFSMRLIGWGSLAASKRSIHRGIEYAEKEQYRHITAMSYDIMQRVFQDEQYHDVKKCAMEGYFNSSSLTRARQLKAELVSAGVLREIRSADESSDAAFEKPRAAIA